MTTDASQTARPESDVDRIADRFLEEFVALSPITATYLGIAGHDEDLDDFSPEGHEAHAELRRRALAELDRATPVDDIDRVTIAAMRERLGLAEETADRVIVWEIADLPAATGDAGLLRQVWYNLIDNAVKYTRLCDKAHIEISAVPTHEGVEYRIADNGVGFDMTYRQKLFGVFQRLQRSEDFEGTGIGLALVKRIVERHGGTVEHTRGPSGETTFVVYFPEPS